MDTLPLFSLGRVVATPGVLDALERTGCAPGRYLHQHVSGDWGDLGPEDKVANETALRTGARLLSAYRLPDGTRIWIITEARGEHGKRAATTLLLPEEY